MSTPKASSGLDTGANNPNEQIKNRDEKLKRRSSLFFGTGTAALTPAPVHIPFRPRRQFPLDTRLSALYSCAETIADSGPPSKVTRPPTGTALREWLQANVLVYYNEANDYYGWLSSDRCNCDKMTIGSKYEFLWADGKTIRTPINIPANDYIDYLMVWIEANLDDTKLFPDYDGAKYSKDFEETVKAIVRRLFRVFGHMQVDHAMDLEACGMQAKHELVFKCFVQFVREYKLMEKKQLKPIHRLMAKWKSEK